MTQRVCDLVGQPFLVQFVYSGKPRTVVLATHGTHKTTGKNLVRGYQVGGATSNGTLPDWKFFEVSKIFSLEVTDQLAPTLPKNFNSADLDLNVHCSK